jgi:hypothetical protein
VVGGGGTIPRRDLAFGLAAGVLLMLLGSFTSIARVAVEAVLQFWYIGLALTIVAVVGRRRGIAPGPASVLGFLGIAWVTAVVAWYVVLLLLYALMPPLGP